MSTLAEIKKAVEKLPPEQKQHLMVFLGAQLRAQTSGHAPRDLPPAQQILNDPTICMKHSRDIPKFLLWLQKRSLRMRELIKNARFHESVADELCRMAQGPTSRCSSQLRFATDCPHIFILCRTSDIVRALAKERSALRIPRFFDLHKEILWQWFCEYDENSTDVLTYGFTATDVLRQGAFENDCLVETLQNGVATVECIKCGRRNLRAEYFEMAKDAGSQTSVWVTKNSAFRCPNCRSQFFVRDDRSHYRLASDD